MFKRPNKKRICTGFGKSMIFTMFSVCARERTPKAVSVLVISPFNSIITSQIADLEELCEAAELKADNLTAILKDPPHFIFASAERLIVVVDESHGGNVDRKKVFLCTHFSS